MVKAESNRSAAKERVSSATAARAEAAKAMRDAVINTTEAEDLTATLQRWSDALKEHEAEISAAMSHLESCEAAYQKVEQTVKNSEEAERRREHAQKTKKELEEAQRRHAEALAALEEAEAMEKDAKGALAQELSRLEEADRSEEGA